MTLAADMLVGFVKACLGFFKHVRVRGIVGNHGRVGRRGQYSKKVRFHPDMRLSTRPFTNSVVLPVRLSFKTNADKMVYELMKRSLANIPALDVDIPASDALGEMHVDQIGTYSCLLVHGDQFGSGKNGGAPLTKVKSKCDQWQALCLRHDSPFPRFKDVAYG